MSSSKKFSAAILAALLVGGLTLEVEGRPQRVDQIPNGSRFECANCHVDPAGGGPRNSFGQMVGQDFLTASGFAGAVVWGPELAGLDADGDGATNGEELGDPEGVWQTGDPAPGDAAAVTLPGDAESFPPRPEPTAIESSTWAAVKSLIPRE